MRGLFYILLGYLSGSILFARVGEQVFRLEDITKNTGDGNPGASNAFRNGGLACGCFTLLGDMAKGFLPVWLYLSGTEAAPAPLILALVLAAPVAGHILPVFAGFRGGKGIAVSFGCLLGLLPEYRPVLALAAVFLIFSLAVRISPNYYRTLFAYGVSAAVMPAVVESAGIRLGFGLIALGVCLKLLSSREEKGRWEVKLLWTR